MHSSRPPRSNRCPHHMQSAGCRPPRKSGPTGIPRTPSALTATGTCPRRTRRTPPAHSMPRRCQDCMLAAPSTDRGSGVRAGTARTLPSHCATDTCRRRIQSTCSRGRSRSFPAHTAAAPRCLPSTPSLMGIWCSWPAMLRLDRHDSCPPHTAAPPSRPPRKSGPAGIPRMPLRP